MVNKAGEILERFAPQLNEANTVRFADLTKRIGSAFPSYRNQLVQNELLAYDVDRDSLDSVRYAAALNVLIDLCQQGWQLEVHDEQLYVKLTAKDSMDKEYIRYRLSSEKKGTISRAVNTKFY